MQPAHVFKLTPAGAPPTFITRDDLANVLSQMFESLAAYPVAMRDENVNFGSLITHFGVPLFAGQTLDHDGQIDFFWSLMTFFAPEAFTSDVVKLVREHAYHSRWLWAALSQAFSEVIADPKHLGSFAVPVYLKVAKIVEEIYREKDGENVDFTVLGEHERDAARSLAIELRCGVDMGDGKGPRFCNAPALPDDQRQSRCRCIDMARGVTGCARQMQIAAVLDQLFTAIGGDKPSDPDQPATTNTPTGGAGVVSAE